MKKKNSKLTHLHVGTETHGASQHGTDDGYLEKERPHFCLLVNALNDVSLPFALTSLQQLIAWLNSSREVSFFDGVQSPSLFIGRVDNKTLLGNAGKLAV